MWETQKQITIRVITSLENIPHDLDQKRIASCFCREEAKLKIYEHPELSVVLCGNETVYFTQMEKQVLEGFLEQVRRTVKGEQKEGWRKKVSK